MTKARKDSDRLAKYKSHKFRAKYRGILWHFNYLTWARKWVESRKWNQRGRWSGDSFVMARYRDQGPYSYENTKIITVSKNISEGHTGQRISEEHKAALSRAHKGRKFSQQHRKRIAEALRGNTNGLGNKNRAGKKHTDASRRKMSISQTGRTHSEETKAKMSKSQRARWTAVR